MRMALLIEFTDRGFYTMLGVLHPPGSRGSGILFFRLRIEDIEMPGLRIEDIEMAGLRIEDIEATEVFHYPSITPKNFSDRQMRMSMAATRLTNMANDSQHSESRSL